MQIYGESARLAELAELSQEDRKPSKLHLPVGGRRFRPCLEDIIEFCIVEGIVEPHNRDWREVIDDKRDQFYRRQLKAAVRQYPLEAVLALERLGYNVSEPRKDLGTSSPGPWRTRER